MLDARIQQQFFDSADWLNQTAEALSRPLAAAAQTLLSCITAGGKVLVLSQPGARALGGYFVQCLMGRLERERPPLAAFMLSARLSESATGHGLLAEADAQLRALGQPGDVLLLILTEPITAATRNLVRLAQDQELIVTALAARAAADIAQELREADILVSVTCPRPSRTQELIFVSLHSLIDAIETQLLGEQDSP